MLRGEGMKDSVLAQCRGGRSGHKDYITRSDKAGILGQGGHFLKIGDFFDLYFELFVFRLESHGFYFQFVDRKPLGGQCVCAQKIPRRHKEIP